MSNDNEAPTKGPGRVKMAYARYMNSKGGLYFAWAFMGLVGACLVFIFVVPDRAGTAGKPTAPAVPTATSSAPTAVDSTPDIGCGAQDPAEIAPETLVSSEFETQWVPTGQMSVPTSATGGPLAAGHCFTRNPEGALYSMATFIAERAGTTTNQGVVDVMAARCLHDDNFEAYSTRLLADQPVTGQPAFAINGYRWMEYSPSRAQVELRFKRITGAEAGTTTTGVYSVIWKNNDWLVLVPNPDQPTRLPGDNLRTFHVWGDTG